MFRSQNVLLLNDRQQSIEWSPSFERMMDWHPSRSLDRSGHSRRKGLLLMGIGAGLAAMFYIQGDTRTVGIGALVFLMGVAFFVNAMLEARSPRPDQEQGRGGS